MFNRIIKSAISVFMVIVTVMLGTPFTAFANSEETVPHVNLYGERVPITDERILNYVPVTPRRTRAAAPAVTGIVGIPAEFERTATVTMNGKKVSAIRYIAYVDGIEYEAFCANPDLPGPENKGAAYQLSGEAGAQLTNVIMNGYPINSEWSSRELTEDVRMWNAYVTRVGVAIANNSSSNFAGDQIAITEGRKLANGETTANHDAYPAILVNGAKDSQDAGRQIYDEAAVSNPFAVTYNRKTNSLYNPFRFEWVEGTPAGAKLLVDGVLAATAPDNPAGAYNDLEGFTIEMPNTAEFQGKTAKVNLVGIHNQYANKIWLMENPNAPATWQKIVFYIPEYTSSASFSFQSEGDVPETAGIRIVKRDTSGTGLAGAAFEVTGPDGYSAAETSGADGTISLTGLEPGEYTVTEKTPPSGYELADPASVTVTIAPDSTETIEQVFINEPTTSETPTPTPTTPEPTTTSVKIQKVDALSRENIPGALVRLRGLSSYQTVMEDGQIQEIDNTGINLSQVLTVGAETGGSDVKSTVSDGVWTLEGLPYGAYEAIEERAPENYSLLPQHTSYSFWLLPGNVTIKLNQDESTEYVDDVELSVYEAMNAAIAGIQNYDDAEALATELQGILDTLLAELKVDAVFTVEADKSTNSHSVVFENYPFGKIEVTKYDEVSGAPLGGTHFRIQGYSPETGTNGMPIDRIQVTGGDGKTLFENLPAGQYTISEVEAPPGYQFSADDHRSVSLTWGQTASVEFLNKPKTFVEVIKVDGNDTSKLLDGAIFRLTDPTLGETWEGTTEGGKVRLGEGDGSFGNQLVEGKLYLLTEIQAPNGYVLFNDPIEVIVAADNQLNTVTVRNYHNPSLTIVKRDKNNGQPRLEGAVFEVAYENGTTISGSPFTTDANGEIVLSEVLFEGNDERTLIITETIPPDGFNLSEPTTQRVTMRKGEDNVVVFENTRKPTLEIVKTDSVTGQNLAGAEFTIEKLEEPGKGMLTGNPFSTDENGRITLPYQYSGKYRIVETKSPDNYWTDPQQQNREWIIEILDNEDYTLSVDNTLLPTLIITKWNAVTYKPVPLTHYRVEYETPNSGQVQLVGEFVTNKNGQVVIPYTRVGWYRVTETRPAPGMSLNSNNSYRVYLNPGDHSYMPIPDVTDNNPSLNPQMPVFKDIQVFGGNDFLASGSEKSYPENSVVVEGEPNEAFTLAKAANPRLARSLTQVNVNADVLGEFSADSSGVLVLGGLDANRYAVSNSKGKTETATLSGNGSIARFDFVSAAAEPTPTPTAPPAEPELETGTDFDEDIEVVDDPALASQLSQAMAVSNGEQYWNSGTGIWNFPLNSIVIKKQDATNGNLLAGATFDLIYTTSGESGTKGTIIGTFTTDHSGIIVITGLEPGNYVVEEVQAPPKYTLSLNNRQNVNLKPDGTSIVETTFSNYPYGSLLIHKVDSVTREPLSGAEFLVTDSEGTVVGTSNGLFTTDADGNILIEKLPPDSYVVREQRSPNGYVIGKNATQTISVQPDGKIYRLEFVNDPLSSLIIRKIDSYDRSPLSDAKFEVRRVDGEFVGEYTTDQQGLIEIPGILGWFNVKEMEAPGGHAVAANNTRTVEVRSQSPTYVTFYNAREGSLTIEKVDGSGSPLAGAQFRVTRQNGEFVGNYTTGASGMINLPDLSAGWYHVAETYAPNGYVISQAGQSAEVKPNSAAHLTFVNLPQPTLTIRKVDETGNPLSGARFMVSHIGGTFSKEVVIGSGGTASVVLPLDVPQANFQIVETHAPQGYTITEPARVITVRAGENYTESFVNYKTPSLVINKHDINGNPISGAEFEVRTLGGELIETVTSNNGGVAAIGSIEPGEYEIIETRAPAGYVVTEQSQIVEISAGETATATFVNERVPGLTIEKVDESGNPLSGAVFEVRTLADTLIERVTTNSGGVANIPQIAAGSYAITEITAPKGYSITEQSRNIEIAAGQSLTERFVNFKQPSIIIEKVDANGQPLANAVFEVRTLDGTRIAELTTNNGGTAIAEGLAPDFYEVVETKAPSGYAIIEQSRIVTVAAGDVATVRFVNFRQPSLVIEKVGGDGNPLGGAEFEVRTLGGELVQRVTTNDGGVASIAVIPAGAYVIAETRAPQGYVMTETARNIEIIAGESITERFVNHKQPSLIIEKVDGDGNPLSGAVFEVRTLDGTKVAEVTTDNGGMATVPGLEPGAYEVVETRAPQGYVVTEISRAIQITAGEAKTERFVNYRQPSLVIEKVDENGQPLDGAEFEIRRLNGELVHRVVTNNGGTATIEQLEPNSYEVIETRAPEGYALVEVSRSIQIVAGQTVTERFVNPKLSTFVIRKIDGDTDKPLENVVFEVTTLEGENVRNPEDGSFEFITDNAGMIRLPQLPAGSYVAVETKALPGYELAEPQVFVVANDKEYIITVRNYKLPDYNILKIDGSNDEPIPDVPFEIAHYYADGRVGDKIRNPQDGSYTWFTDSAGLIRIPNLAHGTYVATEVRPPIGYKQADPAIFVVGDNEPTTITIRNYRYSEWNILKINGDTNAPLQGVVFEVAHYFGDGSTGDKLRDSETGSLEFVTDSEGLIHLGVLEPGTYIANELKPLDGYIKAAPAIFTVTEDDVNTTVTVRNYKRPVYNIHKIDGETNEALSGVVFEIAKYFDNGSSGERVRNPIDGSFEFVTDTAGNITIPTLPLATYVATEIRPLDGYAIADPQVFVVDDIQDTTITIRNYKNPDIVIRKLDADTQEVLEGVQFKIFESLGNGDAGEMLRNPADGGYIWTTDEAGRISINTLEPGVYIAVESRPLPGYGLAEPKTFTVGDGGDTTITIYNKRLSDYAIKKIDGDTNEPLQSVEFEISHYLGEGRNGEKLINPTDGTNTFVTDGAGLIQLPSIDEGVYLLEETRPLPGYKTAEPQTFTVGDGEDRTVTVRNYKNADIVIRKLDSDTQVPLPGVQFKIFESLGNGDSGEMLRNPADNGFIWETDEAGRIHLNTLEDGIYIAVESRPLPGYAVAEPKTFTVGDGGDTTITIYNSRLPDFVIQKVDGDTQEALAGVAFEISRYLGEGQTGERLVNPIDGTTTFVTDEAGMINLPSLEPGMYLATEIRPLPGYKAAEPQTFTVGDGENRTIVIQNYRLPDFVIQKVDGDTNAPLAGVAFEISRYLGEGQVGERLINPADGTNTFVTDNAGTISLPSLEPGMYLATETRPLPGYEATEPQTFTVGDSESRTIVIQNYRLPDFIIQKVDGDTQEVLVGVAFEISRYLGEGQIGERLINPDDGTNTFVTDRAGTISLPSIEPGMYLLTETKPLTGYEPIEPQTFTVGDGENRTIVVQNFRRLDYAIKKVDSDTDKPLEGVTFEIAHYLGEGQNGERLVNPTDGTTTFITDNAGLINLPALESGSYVAIETKPLEGYTAAEPTIFNVGDSQNGTDRTIVIRNKRQAELTIQKINSVNRQPIEGVVFQISRPDGEALVNPKTGNHDFKTDRNGLIHLPVIEDGDYYLTETKAASGYVALEEPVKITISAETRQREHLLVVENTPASGLLIIKRDAATKEPLAGVTFEIRRPDGSLIQGSILDGNQPETTHNSPQLDASGGFVTDNQGRINLNYLEAGVYHVTETKGLDGYAIDSTVHTVTVEPGKQAVLEVENKPLAGLRIKKIDSVTKQGIYNVEFMLFDSSGKVVGNFYSDNNGIVEFPANIVSGRYTIRETRPAANYAPDDMPRTVDFVAGKVTEIVWENVPMGGQLQISKVSGDYNGMNALPPGTPLMGAIFEIYDARTGNVVDRIQSNERGMAVSKPLPLGRYYALEVQAPAYYKINPQPIEFAIEFNTQIIRATFPNFSANVGVSIDKTGPKEVMQGNNINYDVKNVGNESSIPLADFYWRDILPTNAVRADKLVTGTYNVQLRYKVMGVTNKGNEIVIADNLSTTKNNVVEMKPAHLGLAADEWLVEFSLHFGQVPAGFRMVEKAQVFVDVLPKNMATLPNGMMFANKVDVGGKIPGSDEWVIGNSTVGSTVYNPNTPTSIPQSGW